MSTLRANSITNGGSAVNFPLNVKVNNGFVEREYYSQSTTPTPKTLGAIWWDTSANLTKIYLSGEWYTVNAA
jgi:hypothetical protein